MKKKRFKSKEKVLKKVNKLLIKEGVTDALFLVGNGNGRLDWLYMCNIHHADTAPAKAIKKIMEFCGKEVPEVNLDEHKIVKIFEN